MTMASGRSGFHSLRTTRRDFDHRIGGIGSKVWNGSREKVRHADRFGDGEKVRADKERELGNLSSGSEEESPREGLDSVDGILGRVNDSHMNKKRKLSPSPLDREVRKSAGLLHSSNGNSVRITQSGNVSVSKKLEDETLRSGDCCHHTSSDRESGQVEEEEQEAVVTRSISLSRWAGRQDDFGDNADERLLDAGVRVRGTTQSGTGRDHWKHVKGRKDYMDVDVGKSDIDSDDHEVGVDGNFEVTAVGSLERVGCSQRSINMLKSCRSVDNFEPLNRISAGTYGIVYRARDKMTGEIVALKQVKMAREREGFPITALREINILISLDHHSIIDVKEVVLGDTPDKIYIVMEHMDHDIKVLMESMKQPFSQSEVKCLMLQLLQGVHYLHDNWVIHRDLKTSNLLFNNHGELKICDFGLSRQYGSPLKPYTPLVVTLWYRAPELLLGMKQYSTAIDMWSVGCIMAELLSKEPLFNGKTDLDQLDKIFRILGTPCEKIWNGFSKLPGAKCNFVKQPYNKLREKFPLTSFIGRPTLSERGFDLLSKLLTYDPEKRITAEAALEHEWFKEAPFPKLKKLMPTFPVKHS